MMGLPCLRVNGQFFASFDRRTGDLVVKLSEQRVNELIERGEAHPFAPAAPLPRMGRDQFGQA